MAQRSYRFYVKPRSDYAYNAVEGMINAQGHSAETWFHEEIWVGENSVKGVYEMPDHSYLTEIKNSIKFYNDVSVFVQEDEGKIRPYNLFKRRALAKTRQAREAQAFIDDNKA